MTEDASIPQTPAPPRPKSSQGILGRLATILAVALGGAFLLGSAVFIYQESQFKGLPAISGDLAGFNLALSSAGSGDGKQLAHQNGPCTSCHASRPEGAHLYLAVNGRDVTDNPTLALKAGESFELAYHFDGMVAKDGKRTGVGMEVIAPRTGWSVGPGTGKQVQEWSESGTGRAFWSPKWNQAGSGGGKTAGRWKPIPSQSGAFYMDYSSSSWAVPGVSAAARDDGGPGDADGRRGEMGGDALVGVSLNAEPGRYELIVAAAGYDDRGNATQLSRKISVQVDPAPSRTAKSTKPVRFKQDHGTNRPCGSCHSQTLKALPASHQGIANDGCTLCHTTTISGPPPAPTSRVSHPIEGRADCLSCHRADGLRPTPADHGGRANGSCALCHRPVEAPKGGNSPVPHSLEGRADCASCHSSALVPAAPVDHERRPNEMCAVCHPKNEAKASPAPAELPHPAAGRGQCLGCHRTGFLGPVPPSHDGRGEQSCLSCHKAQPRVEVAGRAPDLPHAVEGRTECAACHGPAGMRPAPADHAGRPTPTCAGCHTPSIDRSGAAPKTPHVVEGRESCLTCHSAYLISPVPPSHKDRPNAGCLTCHPEPKG